MKLLIMRHGQSEADILKRCEGRADFKLTDLGKSQVKKTSKYLSQNYDINKIYTSPLKRAYESAKILSKLTVTPIISDDYLMEFNNGLRAGLPYNEAYSRYPAVDTPIYDSNYNQESLLEFRFRADYILSKIIHENDVNATIAIITHGGMINQLCHSFLNLPINEVFFETGDAAFHEWEIDGNESKLIKKSNWSV